MSGCGVCGGDGWKVVVHGAESVAERCGCVAGGRTVRAMAAAGIPPLYAGAALDNFSTKRAQCELSAAVGTASDFIRGFPDSRRRGLLFVGRSGSGKTHLAVAAFRALIGRGFEGLFLDYQSLLDRIRASFGDGAAGGETSAYRAAMDAEILLLDDLGAHRATDFVEDTVTSILTHRCNYQKALIATTNLGDKEAGERLGERARSRLFEMCTVVRMPLIEDYRVGGRTL